MLHVIYIVYSVDPLITAREWAEKKSLSGNFNKLKINTYWNFSMCDTPPER